MDLDLLVPRAMIITLAQPTMFAMPTVDAVELPFLTLPLAMMAMDALQVIDV